MRLNFRQRRLVEISFYNSIEVNAKRSQPSAAPTWNAIGVVAAEGCDLDGLEEDCPSPTTLFLNGIFLCAGLCLVSMAVKSPACEITDRNQVRGYSWNSLKS